MPVRTIVTTALLLSISSLSQAGDCGCFGSSRSESYRNESYSAASSAQAYQVYSVPTATMLYQPVQAMRFVTVPSTAMRSQQEMVGGLGDEGDGAAPDCGGGTSTQGLSDFMQQVKEIVKFINDIKGDSGPDGEGEEAAPGPDSSINDIKEQLAKINGRLDKIEKRTNAMGKDIVKLKEHAGIE